MEDVPPGKALIALKRGMIFDAAGWVFDAEELRDFTDPSDPRPTSFFLMDLERTKTATGFVGAEIDAAADFVLHGPGGD